MRNLKVFMSPIYLSLIFCLLIGNNSVFQINKSKDEKFSINFIKSSQKFNLTETVDVAVGDLDGDGDLDPVLANMTLSLEEECQPSKIWLNDGKAETTTGLVCR